MATNNVSVKFHIFNYKITDKKLFELKLVNLWLFADQGLIIVVHYCIRKHQRKDF